LHFLLAGAGVSPPSGGDSMGDRLVRTAQETISGARNLGNVVGGPAIFRARDRQLIGSVHPETPFYW
jgi:hypothetical protein